MAAEGSDLPGIERGTGGRSEYTTSSPRSTRGRSERPFGTIQGRLPEEIHATDIHDSATGRRPVSDDFFWTQRAGPLLEGAA